MSREFYYERATLSILTFLIITSDTGIKKSSEVIWTFPYLFINPHEYFIYSILYTIMWVQSEFPGSHHTPGNLPLPELIIWYFFRLPAVWSFFSHSCPLQALDKVPALRDARFLFLDSAKVCCSFDAVIWHLIGENEESFYQLSAYFMSTPEAVSGWRSMPYGWRVYRRKS